jgi:hypothetical protein
MDRKEQEERLKQAQRIVARYVAKDRDLVAELIAERRAEAAAECAEPAYSPADMVRIRRRLQVPTGEPPAGDEPGGEAAAPTRTT